MVWVWLWQGGDMVVVKFSGVKNIFVMCKIYFVSWCVTHARVMVWHGPGSWFEGPAMGLDGYIGNIRE